MHDSDDVLSILVSWSSRWRGPISLVLITAEHQSPSLIARLQSLKSHPSLSKLWLHLVPSSKQYNSAQLLNLARFFAPTRSIMLWPASPAAVILQVYDALISQIGQPIQKPLLLSPFPASVFSIPSLTPVVLSRDYRLWCSERAFLGSRSSDWDECVWFLWLEEYGLESLNVTSGSIVESKIRDDNRTVDRFVQRLSAKHRAETCEVTLRRLSGPDAPRPSRAVKKKMQWVKGFCRQTENNIKNAEGE
ncbi:unnamed protein product [Mycena citricolor]|uniref:Uncharacterized protein n=1 Tax=Mycena citricolor TaxID=2018698 RepID=A0AAD2HVY0_9AGAR|nr:unnamed protein product [Mycena citricolor]